MLVAGLLASFVPIVTGANAHCPGAAMDGAMANNQTVRNEG